MSLGVRLAFTFAAVVAISLIFAATSLVALLRGYSARLTQARLDDVATVVFVQMRGLMARGQTPLQVVDFLNEQATSLDVRIMVLDPRGTVIREAGSGPSLLGQAIPIDYDALRQGQALLGEPGPARRPVRGSFELPRDRQPYYYAAVPIALAPARLADPPLLLIAQREGPLLDTLRPLLVRLGLAALAGLLAGLLAAYLLARWLGQPLSRLIAATQAVARGDYSPRVQPSGPPELVRLTDSFNLMAGEVERSRALVGRFVSTLSHELRTPLTSIRGFAQAVLDGRASEPAQLNRAMEIVDHEARRMQRLCAELLDLSRLQAGQVPLRSEAVDLRAIAAQCVEVLENRAETQGVTIRLEVEPDLLVSGDADRLEQVITNLLDNALKFTPRGAAVRLSGRFVGVAAGRSSGSTRELRLFGRPRTPPPPLTRWAVIEVANPGPPIADEELQHIFEQFYTGSDGQERGGIGLGLPIAREIARAHGGDLSAESSDGLTVFRLSLPAARPARDRAVTPDPLTTAARS